MAINVKRFDELESYKCCMDIWQKISVTLVFALIWAVVVVDAAAASCVVFVPIRIYTAVCYDRPIEGLSHPFNPKMSLSKKKRRGTLYLLDVPVTHTQHIYSYV